MIRIALLLLFLSTPSYAGPLFFGDPGPAGGHRTMRLGAEGGTRTDYGAAWNFSYRFALHDLLDRQNEYPSDTQIEFGGIRVSYFPQVSKLSIDEIVALRILRMPPLTASWEELTWKVEAGWRTLRDSTCLGCGAANLLAGLGGAVQPISQIPITLWGLAEAEFLASNGYTGFPIKPSIGPRVGVRFQFAPWLNGMLYGLYRFQFASTVNQLSEWGTEWRVSLLRNLAINGCLSKTGIGWEFQAGAFFYF